MHPCPHPFLLCHTCHVTDCVHVFWRVYNLRLMLNVGLHQTQDVTVMIKVVRVPGPILYPLLLMCTCFRSCSQHIVGPSVLLYKHMAVPMDMKLHTVPLFASLKSLILNLLTSPSFFMPQRQYHRHH